MGVRDQHVDRRLRDVDRQGSQSLDGVDDEKDATLAAKPPDVLDRIDPSIVEGHPGHRDDPRGRVDPGRDVLDGDSPAAVGGDPVFDAALGQERPRVMVRGELHVVAHDVVALLPVEGLGHQVDPPRGRGKEGNLPAVRAQKQGGLFSGGLDVRVPRAPVGRAAVPDVLQVRLDRRGGAARQRSDRGMVEVHEVPADGELVIERGV